jgi:hypothetical protein
MNDILEWLVTAENTRRQAKVKHLMRDIINRRCVFRRGCKHKRTDRNISVCGSRRKTVERIPGTAPRHTLGVCDGIAEIPARVSEKGFLYGSINAFLEEMRWGRRR